MYRASPQSFIWWNAYSDCSIHRPETFAAKIPMLSAMIATLMENSFSSGGTSSAINAKAPTYTAPPTRPTQKAGAIKDQSYQNM